LLIQKQYNTHYIGTTQMTFNVHQHWDRLKVCAVGRSYPPEFYQYITNSKVRSVLERIAEETEEDYQKLLKILHSFDVETVRCHIESDPEEYRGWDGKYYSPISMVPRDNTAMIGNKFFMQSSIIHDHWSKIRGPNWPLHPHSDMSPEIMRELKEDFGVNTIDDLHMTRDMRHIKPIEDLVRAQGNEIIYDTGINTAMTTRIGLDLYHGTESYEEDQSELLQQRNNLFPNYRNHIVNSGGHSDGTFCPVKPGLIVSLQDIPTYQETFPDWEVVYLPGQSWESVMPFLELKEKNKGKFWVPGEELNNDFTEFVESWLSHWVGYVEETVFDVNMLVIDEHNVIVNNENDQVFEAFERHGITPHVCNFRHRYFWDGGIHCITSDLHREGTQQDYFPERD
jgi:hypothetical protein